MKILFVAQNLQMGGIQKALVNLIKELQIDNKYEIDVFSFGDGILMKEIPGKVTVRIGTLLLRLTATPFSIVIKNRNFLHIILRILCMILVRIIGSEMFYNILFKRQKEFDNYDIAISYFNDVQKGYFNRGTNQFVMEFINAKRKIAWIHTDPKKAEFEYSSSHNSYKNFDKIVCVSKACRSKFIEIFPEFSKKTYVVYNFLPKEEIMERSNEYTPFEKDKINIVSVGRMENSTKRYNIIPEICKMLKDDLITNFKWRIIGDGPDFELNKQIASKLDVLDLVEFVGEKVNPYPYIKESDIFILTSAYEGYPMVIGEALILQTPVVTTSYAAVSEQIINNHNGIITDMAIENIFVAIKKLLKKPKMIENLKNNNKRNTINNSISLKQFSEVISLEDGDYKKR
ncbi:glycosyltransferase [Rummeliibacillus pycnus]|uniref:glycosyltransferase n=1 Tax=Rummeliibacillus pycnus TaxID=101070 RepID=UPI000C9B7DC7|nr:glycosyltransferase [Rummeliibacillus pycnus]